MRMLKGPSLSSNAYVRILIDQVETQVINTNEHSSALPANPSWKLVQQGMGTGLTVK